MAQVGDVIRASQPASRSVARPTNEPWVRWLETPDHLVAVIDKTGEATLDVDGHALNRDGEVRAAPGAVQVDGGSVRVRVGELTDGPAAVLLSKR
jgi:alpha-L-fucosidase